MQQSESCRRDATKLLSTCQIECLISFITEDVISFNDDDDDDDDVGGLV